MEFVDLSIPDDFDPQEAPEVNQALAVYAQLYPEIDLQNPDFGGELLLTCFPFQAASISVVRDHEGRVQGAAYLHLQPDSDADYLEGLVVDIPMRRQGVGRYMMEGLIDKSRTEGQSAIQLRPLSTSLGFYSSLGFHAVKHPNVLRLDIPRS